MEILEPDLRMYTGEARGLFVEVRNESGEEWPGGLEQEPRIRLSYHWRGSEGEVEGPRTPLPAPLAPGETAIAPVTVLAPPEPGRYLLELDLVHEDVRWLGGGRSAQVEVVAPGETQRNVRHRRLARQRIPRVIHRIWLGPEPMPEEHVAFGETWREHHPRWEQRLWTDAELGSLGIPAEALSRAPDRSQLSELGRYHLLALHGGVYIDTDFECLRSIEPLLGGLDAFAGFEMTGTISCAMIGCVPNHPALRRAAALSLVTVGTAESPAACGPPFLTHVLWEFPEVTLFPRELFYPYGWDEPHRRHERFPNAYAVHHWAMSWREPMPAP
jgi:hypothetical protein